MEDRVEVEVETQSAPGPAHVPAGRMPTSPGLVEEVHAGVMLAIENYGWYMLVALISLYWLHHKLQQRSTTPSASASSASQSMPPHQFLAQQEKIAAARAAMQDRLDAEVAKEKVRVAEKEQLDYERKQQEWTNLQEGRGYYSKMKKPEQPQQEPADSVHKMKKKEPIVKRDYNPLQSSGPTCSWRPSARSSGGGGGG
jgi:hypothetical protein